MSEQSSGRTSVEQIIKAAVARGASDLHIKAGDVFRARINGELVPLTKQRLTPEQHLAFSRRLGPLSRSPYIKHMAEYPDIIAVLKEAEENLAYRATDTREVPA